MTLRSSSKIKSEQNSTVRSEIPYVRNNDHFQRILEKLHVLRQSGRFCDVVLIVDKRMEKSNSVDEDRLQLPAHRAILSAGSPYFYAMFTGNMIESNQREIYIHDINPEALSILIDYIYSSKIDINEDSVQILLPAADLLQLNDVCQACFNFLDDQLDPSNCIGIRALADLYSCPDLLKKANSFIERHFSEIIQSEEFVNLDRDQMIRLACSDELVATEETIFESVMRWLRHDPEGRKDALGEIMKGIRLPLLSSQYLVKKVSSDPLVRGNPNCKDYLIEALTFHAMGKTNKEIFTSPRGRPRRHRLFSKLMYAIGGESPKVLKEVDVYDFETQLWSKGTQMQGGRSRCGVAVLDRCIYLIGGYSHVFISSINKYEPSADKWMKEQARMCFPRAMLGVAVLDGVIYAVGGKTKDRVVNFSESYDARTKTWMEIASMSTNRSGVGVVSLNGFIYAIGGSDDGRVQSLSSVERYDPRMNRWCAVSDMTVKRFGAGICVYNEKIYVAGGRAECVTQSAEMYDPVFDVWKPIATMNLQRKDAGFVEVCGKLYCVGGYNGNLREASSYLNSIECYDPEIDSWELMWEEMPRGRSCSSVVVLDKLI